VLIEKANPAQVNKYKIRGDVDNGLAAGTFGYSPKDWHDYGSVTAINAAQGKVAWKQIVPEPGRGGVTTTASGLAFVGGGDGVLRAYDTYTGNPLWSFQTGYQIASGPSIYEDHGKEYIAITVGGTATSSYGGTATQLQVFALKGDLKQSLAPPIRAQGPGPGVLRAPPEYFAAGAQPHTVTLQLVASQDDPSCKSTLDGATKGNMTVRVPEGWTVYVTFANHGATCADGLAVVNAAGSTMPVFSGGTTAAPVSGGGVGYFKFTGSHQGSYALASTVRSRALAGEWIHFNVVGGDQPPELTLPDGQQFAIIGRPGLGGTSAGG
jgi:hypothetical protein